jgi:hypothetical protein
MLSQLKAVFNQQTGRDIKEEKGDEVENEDLPRNFDYDIIRHNIRIQCRDKLVRYKED